MVTYGTLLPLPVLPSSHFPSPPSTSVFASTVMRHRASPEFSGSRIFAIPMALTTGQVVYNVAQTGASYLSNAMDHVICPPPSLYLLLIQWINASRDSSRSTYTLQVWWREHILDPSDRENNRNALHNAKERRYDRSLIGHEIAPHGFIGYRDEINRTSTFLFSNSSFIWSFPSRSPNLYCMQ